MSTKLEPLWGNVVVKVDDADDISSGGIVLPEQAKEKPKRGTVLAVGPGSITPTGQRIEPAVKIGDVVVFTHYAGNKVELGDDEVTIMNGDTDILAIVRE